MVSFFYLVYLFLVNDIADSISSLNGVGVVGYLGTIIFLFAEC